MSKLNTNESLINKPIKLFKSNKFKALLGASLIAATLSSCNTNSNQNIKEDNSQSYVQEMEEENYFGFSMNFNNVDEEAKKNEVITVFNDKGTITNTINLRYGDINSALNTKSIKMYSNYLNQFIDIPEINEDEIFVINIDYATKEISTSIEKTNAKTR